MDNSPELETMENNRNEIEIGKCLELEEIRLTYGPREDRRILRNLFTIGITFVLLFGSFNSISSLQSSLYGKNGLGAYGLSAIYVSGSLSAIFFLSPVLSHMTTKTAMISSMPVYIAYVIAQLFPSFGTIIPAGLAVGFGGMLLWTAVSKYISQISQEYAHIKGESVGVVLSNFFGLFFLIFLLSYIWGNGILIFVFSTVKETQFNETLLCGASFCPATVTVGNVTGSSPQVDASTINLLIGVTLACAVIPIFILLFAVDPLNRYGEGCGEMNTKRKLKDLLLATIRQMMDSSQLRLIPFMFFSTFQTGFILIDFTAGFITCALGVEWIGRIMICYGTCAAVSSCIFGRLVKYIGRIPTFSIVFVIHLIADFILLFWDLNNPDLRFLFFIVACMEGIGEGVFSSQLQAFSALVFPNAKEAAFNNNRLWQGLAYVIAYTTSTMICMTLKVYMVIVVGIVGFIGYITVEISYAKTLSSTPNIRLPVSKII